ncbi:MAG: cob(I)yrinic acid a,c-diamide adenosyltransferase [Phycisphaerae bacterium]|nr:cob(I)yrinic acid a,c-diamide adenosyltransferase [Phycisphaerae bacterium]
MIADATTNTATNTLFGPVRRTRGMVHVYTGEGKGKTTASIGLAVRAAGAGLNVFFAQFLKGQPTSELAMLARLSDRIMVRRFGGHEFVRDGGTAVDAAEAARGLATATEAITSGRYGLIVLDEINLAVATGLLDVTDVLAMIDLVPPTTTLVLTGRYATDAVIRSADLVTEMREIKHYYHSGVPACAGIEM